jgi:hypothetical protein
VQVIDARTGAATTLHESTDTRAGGARIVGDEVEVAVGGTVMRFRLDGAPNSAYTVECEEVPGGARIKGRTYPGVTCRGVFSPDGKWMTYAVDNLPPPASSPGTWDQWVVDLDSGETRMLQEGLVHCGGCDGRYGPSWSASSRYVAYAETGGNRRFLSDVSSGATRQIGSGGDIGSAPTWSSSADWLVYQMTPQSNEARFEDLESGTASNLPIAWPAQFDASGRVLYSPAWGSDPKSPPGTTTIFDPATWSVVATLAGQAPWESMWNGTRPVGLRDGDYVAAVERAPGCDGTAIYVEGRSAAGCVLNGVRANVSPDGSYVAVARNEGATGTVTAPGIEATSLTRYSVAIVDMATGATRSVVADAPGYAPPVMAWNAAGTHLVVLWPNVEGI